MAFSINTPIGGGAQAVGNYGFQGITEVSTTQKFPLGFRVRAYDPTYGETEFVYVKGVASVAAGDFIAVKPGADAIRAVARGIYPRLGVAMAAIVADRYGWAAVNGMVEANVAAGCAAGASLYLTATAGVPDDAVVAGDNIFGASCVTLESGGKATVFLTYPCTGDTDNA